jgi:hypothetical protein
MSRVTPTGAGGFGSRSIPPPRRDGGLGQREVAHLPLSEDVDYSNTKEGAQICETDAQTAGNCAAKKRAVPVGREEEVLECRFVELPDLAEHRYRGEGPRSFVPADQ